MHGSSIGWRRPRRDGSESARSAGPWFAAVAAAAALALAVPASTPGRGEAVRRPGVHRLGVVGFYNPRLMYARYQPLVEYLSSATGESWELAVTLHYEDTVRSLCGGEIDAAYLGPFTYLRAEAACGARPVVRLNTGGASTYTSLVMVRKESAFDGLADLRGGVFAFGSPLSTSSHLVPRLMLQEAGLRPGRDIACRYYGHHDRAALAVLLGEADACGVRDIVGERFRSRGLRVLARSGPIPNFPLVVAPGAPERLRAMLVEALVRRPEQDPGIRRIMRGWDVELAGGFATAAGTDYRPVMTLVERVFGPAGLTASPEALRCGGP